MNDDQLLTITETAELLRTPVVTLRWWRHTGKGPRSFKIGRAVRNARSPVNSRAPATTNHCQRPFARPVTAEDFAGSSPVGSPSGACPRSGVGSSANGARQPSLPRKTDGPDTAGERCRAPWERRAGQPATRRYPPARQSGAGVAGSRRRLGRLGGLGRRTIGRRSGTTGGRGRTTRGCRRSAAWR